MCPLFSEVFTSAKFYAVYLFSVRRDTGAQFAQQISTVPLHKSKDVSVIPYDTLLSEILCNSRDFGLISIKLRGTL